jgi:hypothetical protein
MSVKVGLWDNMHDASEEDTKEEKIAVSEACPVFVDRTPDPRLDLDVTKGLSDGTLLPICLFWFHGIPLR